MKPIPPWVVILAIVCHLSAISIEENYTNDNVESYSIPLDVKTFTRWEHLKERILAIQALTELGKAQFRSWYPTLEQSVEWVAQDLVGLDEKKANSAQLQLVLILAMEILWTLS